METKEQLLEMLDHIQHHCHQQYNCDRCIFKYKDGAIDKFVFLWLHNDRLLSS